VRHDYVRAVWHKHTHLIDGGRVADVITLAGGGILYNQSHTHTRTRTHQTPHLCMGATAGALDRAGATAGVRAATIGMPTPPRGGEPIGGGKSAAERERSESGRTLTSLYLQVLRSVAVSR
jgi:hypothetical protein